MSVLSLSDIHLGSVVEENGQPYAVIWSDFMRTAQRKPVKRTKLKNLIDGRVIEKTYKPGDKIIEADIERNKADYLYSDGNQYNFMEQSTFEQFSMNKDDLGDISLFLKDNLMVDVLKYNGRPVAVSLPPKIDYVVKSAPDAIKGDSSNNPSKTITLENGLDIQAPLFIKEGEKVRVSTETGEYVERA
ncbi:MAG: elongation factor P, partial [bacterium]